MMKTTNARPINTAPVAPKSTTGRVYCYICTHTVDADVVLERKSGYVKPGQKCARCNSSLDAGYVVRYDQAA